MLQTDTLHTHIQTHAHMAYRHYSHIDTYSYIGIETETQGQANSQDSLHAGIHSGSCKTEAGRHMGHETEHSNLDSLAE